MEAASLVQVARKNIVVRSRPVHLREYTDIFSCSTVEGESHVYVLPTQHDTEVFNCFYNRKFINKTTSPDKRYKVSRLDYNKNHYHLATNLFSTI
jgi:hypothetical protein